MDLVTVHATRSTITLHYGEHSVTDHRYLIGGGDVPEVTCRQDTSLSSLPEELAMVAYPPGPDRQRVSLDASRAIFVWRRAGSPLTSD